MNNTYTWMRAGPLVAAIDRALDARQARIANEREEMITDEIERHARRWRWLPFWRPARLTRDQAITRLKKLRTKSWSGVPWDDPLYTAWEHARLLECVRKAWVGLPPDERVLVGERVAAVLAPYMSAPKELA